MSFFTVAVNAGGKSSRMGTDKSFVRLMGKPLIEHVLAKIGSLGQVETILITHRPEDYAHLNVTTYVDVLSDKGSLGGIYTAISVSRSPYTLVLACDMPFVSPALLRYMLDLSVNDEFDVIVPRSQGYPEGLHAVYSRACLMPIRQCLDADLLKVSGFYEAMRVRYLDEAEYRQFDPAGLSFFNVNTREDLAEAEKLMNGNSATEVESGQ